MTDSAEFSITPEASVAISEERWYFFALLLSGITIGYNVIEGVVSTFFGVQDEALTLFGFGVDSFIEVISGIGVMTMILRIRRSPGSSRQPFEIQALRVTGVAFYLLTVGLALMTVLTIVQQQHPRTTLAGVLIALVSILSMWALIRAKRKVGYALQSQPLLADANCTKVCLMMSVVLLGASLLYELTHIAYIDSIGTIGIMYYSWQEGRECFDKVRNKECSCHSCH